MSNVHKSSQDFIPENLVPEKLDEPAVWGNFAKKLEVYQQHAAPLETPKDIPQQIASEPPHEEEQTSQHFDSDFSAPHTKADNLEQAKDEAEVEDKEPEVDIEALAEEYFNKGVLAGIEQIESDYGSSIKTLQSTCEQLNTIRETILKNSIDEIKELVLKISEKIIRHSLAEQQQTIINTVEEAIQQAVKSDEFIISVSPNDYEIIHSRSSDFINSVSGLENIIIRSDTKIEQGGCIVESSNCTVDATLISQLEIIDEHLKQQ